LEVQIHKGKKIQPRRTLLYGVHGVGKSEWASQAPGVLFLNLEDGLNDIDCESSGVLTTFELIMDALRWLAESEHTYQYVCIDSLDWLETLIHKEVAHKAGKPSIADIGYGAGYKQALALWDRVLFALEWLRKEKGIGIIMLAHADIKKFSSPEQDSYDRYQPALHESASSLLQEWCDEVFFASYRVMIRKEDQGFNKTRNIAVDVAERYIRTTETAAVLAKNRLNMPPEIPFPRHGGWAEYAKFFPKPGNIDGVVKDGSSKAK
jgi:hypothetical protein